jgi:nucleotide-binding universal stress UspA family protein
VIRTILVGLDGSPGSVRALEWAISRATELGAVIIGVHGMNLRRDLAFGPSPEMGVQALDLTGVVKQAEQALERDWSAPLVKAGVPHRTLLVEADPVQAILEAADHLSVDMIVLGSHGHGGFVDRLLGSVTYKVAHRASQPVVIVPPPRDR